MTEGNSNPPDPSRTITRAETVFMVLWTAGIILLAVLCGFTGVRYMRAYKAETERTREILLQAAAGSSAGTGERPSAVPVRVAMSLDRISEIDQKETAWTADFHLWFRWSGDGVDPGATFELLNGKILEREKVAASVQDGTHAELIRGSARMTMSFDPSRFPLGDQGLSIQILDGLRGAGALRYVADDSSVLVRPAAVPQGLSVVQVHGAVLERTFKGAGTEPPSAYANGTTRSIFVAAMLTRSPVLNRYFRLFQALFASVAISFIVFFIRPIHVDPRFGLPVGGFFAAVGNNIAVVSLLPDSGRLTLVQLVNAISLATIFLTLVESAISLYAFDTLGRTRFSRVLDTVSFIALGVSYIVLNLILPLAAR